MNKKLFLLLTLASFASVIQSKPYTITAEDKACTNKAEGYNELTDCFNKIGNKADNQTLDQLKARNMNLYKQYDKEANKLILKNFQKNMSAIISISDIKRLTLVPKTVRDSQRLEK